MSWTAPPTYTTGQLMTAAIGNAQWRDNLLVLKTNIDDNGHFAYSVVSKNVDYTLTATDDFVKVDASGAARTQTLPSAVSNPKKQFTIKKVDSSANAVHIQTTSAQTIDAAAAPFDITVQNVAITLQSDGANWIIV